MLDTRPQRNNVLQTCSLVLGDLDYVACPALMREMYGAPWEQWQALTRSVLRRAQAGEAQWVSLYARGQGMSEASLLSRLVAEANEFPGLRVLLHHYDAHAAVPALKERTGPLLLSHVSGESWMLPQIDAVLRQHRPQLVVQPIDDGGIPDSAEGRMDVIEAVYERVAGAGLLRSDLFVDALSPSCGALPFPLQVSVDTVALANSRGFGSVAWPANAGLGHGPLASSIASAYATALVQVGLRLAVVASSDTAVVMAVKAANRLRQTCLESKPFES